MTTKADIFPNRIKAEELLKDDRYYQGLLKSNPVNAQIYKYGFVTSYLETEIYKLKNL